MKTRLIRADKLPTHFRIPTTMQGPLHATVERIGKLFFIKTSLGVPVLFQPWQRLLVIQDV